MIKISSVVHGVLDYLTVGGLLLAPALFQLDGVAGIFTYILAIVHLLLTVFTDFEAGLFKVIPFKIHGAIELIVSISLVGVSFWFKNNDSPNGFLFYIIFAGVVFVLWLLSDYRAMYKWRSK